MFDAQKIIEKIRGMASDYLGVYNLKSVILGMSGGIDSAVVAALMSPVCRQTNIKLIGYCLPSSSNTNKESDRAIRVGKSLCNIFKIVDLDEYGVTNEFVMDGDERYPVTNDSIELKIRRGNIKARLRMIYLYDKAAKHNGLVLSTDNYTEYLLGFWTLHGDVGDLGIIQGLWKTEVYNVANYILRHEMEEGSELYKGFLDTINAVPTDGLGITNSDLDQLGANSYETVDNILKQFMSENTPMEDVRMLLEHPVIIRHDNTHFKRSNPVNFMRKDIDLSECEAP